MIYFKHVFRGEKYFQHSYNLSILRLIYYYVSFVLDKLDNFETSALMNNRLSLYVKSLAVMKRIEIYFRNIIRRCTERETPWLYRSSDVVRMIRRVTSRDESIWRARYVKAEHGIILRFIVLLLLRVACYCLHSQSHSYVLSFVQESSR